jgi:hypothetical protein
MRKILLAAMLVSVSAHAQLTSFDGGLAVEDNSGLMFANTIGSGLSWLATGYTGSAQAWVASLNSEDYGGYNDWTLASGDGNNAPNSTTNQLGDLFLSDCGNAAGGATSLTNPGKNCAAFTSLTTALQGRSHAPGSQIFYSGSLYSSTCCGTSTTSWWSYIVEPKASGQVPWNYDSSFYGKLEDADAIAVRDARTAPEISSGSATSAIGLLVGALVLWVSRRNRSPSDVLMAPPAAG